MEKTQNDNVNKNLIFFFIIIIDQLENIHLNKHKRPQIILRHKLDIQIQAHRREMYQSTT
tara:strand:+ start:253 stop:432 length:180 start_codon:yes stop_codon:yes gene_type:complete